MAYGKKTGGNTSNWKAKGPVKEGTAKTRVLPEGMETAYLLKVKTDEGFFTIGSIERFIDTGHLTTSMNVGYLLENNLVNERGYINRVYTFPADEQKAVVNS